MSVPHLEHGHLVAVWIGVGVSVFMAIGASLWVVLSGQDRTDDNVLLSSPKKRELLEKTSLGKFR